MKLALGLMYAQERHWLSLHLPVFAAGFDGIVAVGDDDTDGSTQYLQSLGADVTFHKFQQDWSAQFNRVIERAEALGYDALLRLDPDEAIFRSDVEVIRKKLTYEATLLVFARHEFYGSRRQVRPDTYPDYQARAWRLGRGIRLGGAKHEGINFTEHELYEATDDPNKRVLRLTNPAIYHYGWSSPQAIWNAMTKYQSQAQLAAGQGPEVNFPPEQPLAEHMTVPFSEEQPLDPGKVGEYAPFGPGFDRHWGHS